MDKQNQQETIVSFIWDFFQSKNKNMTTDEIANTVEISYQPCSNGNHEEWVLVAEIYQMRGTKNIRKKVYLEEDLFNIDDLFSKLLSRKIEDSDAKNARRMSKLRREKDIDVFKIGKFFYYEDTTQPKCMVIRITPYKSITKNWLKQKKESQKHQNMLAAISQAIIISKERFAY